MEEDINAKNFTESRNSNEPEMFTFDLTYNDDTMTDEDSDVPYTHESFDSYVKKKLRGYEKGIGVSNEMIVRIRQYSDDIEQQCKPFVESNKFKQNRLIEYELEQLNYMAVENQYSCNTCGKDIRYTKCSVICSYNYFDNRECKFLDRCHKRHYPYMLNRSVKFVAPNGKHIYGKIIKEIESLSDKLLVEMDAYNIKIFWESVESIEHTNYSDKKFCACHEENGDLIKKFVYVPKEYVRFVI